MKSQDYNIMITVNATAEKAFNCINDVTKWWTINLQGSSQKLNDEFSVRFGDVHFSKQKLTEVVPNKKVVWLVTESRLNFTKDQQEWTNTRISFELFEKGDKTQILFTHHGLLPEIECYNDCSNAWAGYIKESLSNFINTGKGQPTERS